MEMKKVRAQEHGRLRGEVTKFMPPLVHTADNGVGGGHGRNSSVIRAALS